MVVSLCEGGKVESPPRFITPPSRGSFSGRRDGYTAALARVVAAMADPAFELDANEAAGVIAAFNQARAAGHPFDPFTVALVGVLRRQIAETFEDVEGADIDDGFEQDDADAEDGEFSSTEPQIRSAWEARVA